MRALCLSILILAWNLGSISAHPSHSSKSQSPNPAHIMRRALPQLANFSDKDSQKEVQIQQGILDMVTIVSEALEVDDNLFGPIMEKYFGTIWPAQMNTIKAIMRNLLEPSSDPNTGADRLKYIIIDGLDFKKDCSGGVIAYAVNGDVQQGQRIHLCDVANTRAYAYPKLSDLSCDTVGDEVGVSMLSFGGTLLLHEFVHINTISKQFVLQYDGLPARVVGDYAYGPQHTRLLAQNQAVELNGRIAPKQWAIGNADSYVWFINELYWTRRCGKDFADPSSNDNNPPGVCLVDDLRKKCILL